MHTTNLIQTEPSAPHLTALKHAGVGDEGGTHQSGMDAGVAIEHHLVVQDLCEAHHAELGGAVVGEPVEADDARRAGHVDNVAVVLGQHRRQKELGGLHNVKVNLYDKNKQKGINCARTIDVTHTHRAGTQQRPKSPTITPCYLVIYWRLIP